MQIEIQFWKFSNKRWPSEVMYFSTSGLRKTWLDKCLKKPVSGNPLASNMANGPKHCWNLNGSNFTIFIGKYEGNSVAKSVSLWYAKYSDIFLTHWVHMTIILFFKLTIYCNILRCNYLRKKKVFWFFFCFFFVFFFHSRTSESIWNTFTIKMILIADVFLNLRTPKYVVR